MDFVFGLFILTDWNNNSYYLILAIIYQLIKMWYYK